ncbi:MAG: OmpA family protein [Pseudomonadota bacterium]|nr:OmpA family protein [Pseudomonadota bacterium]
MKNHRYLAMTLIAAAVMAGCSTLPESDSPLAQARRDYSDAQANPQVTSLAPMELRQASDSLDKANAASSKGDDRSRVDHLAYVAKQHVAIAQQTARQKAAELAVATASAERDRVRLEARTREADSAQRSAEYSQRQSEESRRQSEASQRQSEASQRSAEASLRRSEASQRDADASQRQSEASQRSAEAAQRQAFTERQVANDAQLSAQAARQQAQDAEGRARQLEALLRDLEAKKTERGMVITLGDVLFDTNQAQLRSGGMRSVQRLADFFKQYPQRKVMIEGFTDSVGSSSRNQDLSDERARSVRTALLGMGVSTDRISSRGYGESHPAATNETPAGRQQNRRVEIIVSDDSGVIAPR